MLFSPSNLSFLFDFSSWLSLSVLGAIACACGDTWASEVGPAFGDGTSRLISTGSKVPAGKQKQRGIVNGYRH